MTPTFRVVGDQLQEQPRMKMPNISEFDRQQPFFESKMDMDYALHKATLRRYTIRPSDWEGITEVNDGEFEEWHEVFVRGNWEKCHPFVYDRYNDAERRLLAVPLRPAGKGQEERLWIAYHNECIYESAAYPISVHKTKKGAEKAMEWHKQEAYNKWKEMNDYHVKTEGEPWDVKFGEHEAWFVQSTPLLP